MRGKLLLFFSIAYVLFIGKLSAQDTIVYSLRFSNAVHHESEIAITYTNVSTPFLKLFMGNYSPGRYANHQFVKNVYGVKAFSLSDEPLKVIKINPNEWLVEVVDGFAKINYTLYANYADGTYSGIDRQFVNLNIPSALIWAFGMENRPVEVEFHFPNDNWKVATQLKELKKNESYFAPDLAYLFDSPVIIGDLDSRLVFSSEKDSIFLYLNPGSEDPVEDVYAEMVTKVVAEQLAVYGELPDFEFDEYKFLCSYGPGFHGDGMEHRNSTMITSGNSLKGNEKNLIATVAHEFFHCWNVERLRPKSLEPFNYLNASMTGELWFAEGFTTYYTPLTLRRAAIYDDSLFTQNIEGMLNYVMLLPGTGKYSPVEMSAMAPITDAASFNDPTNFHNNFTSYYPYGAVLGLALDLELRSQFGLSLDGYMKTLWEKFGKPEIPYTNEDLKTELGSYTGNKAFSQIFFTKYVYGTELPDFESLLKNAGFQVHLKNENGTDLIHGDYGFEDGAVVFNSQPLETSTLYVAGINEGDRILSINERTFVSREDFYAFISSLTPGMPLRVKYTHYGKEYKSMTMTKPDRSILISDVVKHAPEKISQVQMKFRSEWLSSRVAN